LFQDITSKREVSELSRILLHSW